MQKETIEVQKESILNLSGMFFFGPFPALPRIFLDSTS